MVEGEGDGSVVWVPRLRREFRDEEVVDLVNLLRELEGARV